MSKTDDIITEMILAGAAEVAGIDSKTGELVYSFTPKLEEVNPELYKLITNSFYEDIVFLWEKGFLDVDFENPEPSVMLTPKSLDEASVSELDKQRKHTLDFLVEKLLREY